MPDPHCTRGHPLTVGFASAVRLRPLGYGGQGALPFLPTISETRPPRPPPVAGLLSRIGYCASQHYR